MRKERWLALILALAFIMAGCSMLKRDQRYSNWGFDELSDGNYKKAEEYLQKALEANPDNPYAILNMGVVYQHTGRKDQARQMYEKVLALEERLKNKHAHRSNKDWARWEKLGKIAQKNLETL
jgi:Tfp pilus assembly protein PilF